MCKRFISKNIVLYHHERIDGKGYPDKLKGNSIPYFARILVKPTEDGNDLIIDLNPDFKEQLKNVKNGDFLDLINFFKENFIKQTINQVIINS